MNPLGVDKVICLCLDKRENMWRNLESQCLAKGWDFKPFIVGDGSNKELKYDLIDEDEEPPIHQQSIYYPTWWKRPNAYNAWKSHKAMIDQCLKDNVESVMFLEDDTIFMEDYDEKYPLIETGLKLYGYDWNIFYFGSFVNNDTKVIYIDKNILRVEGGAGGWHAVAIKRPILKRLAKFPPFGPFDYMCQKYIQRQYPCYIAFPPLMRQQGAFSYVEGHYLGRREEDNYQ